MGPFDALSLKAEERGLRFIVIGGHAVIGHGYIRATDDADIMVNREKREQWVKLMTDLGYALHHDGGSFLQFSAPNETEWDIDWMLAPAETFNRMLSEAKPEQVDRIHVVIPKLEHLFALKLHAAKHGPGLRKLKDVDDIIRLAILNHFDVPNRFGPYVKSTRTKKCMKESSGHALNEAQTPYAPSSGADLEFPDWSGHRESRSKVTKEEMLRYCESVLPLVKRKPGYRELRRRTACSVEFSLD